MAWVTLLSMAYDEGLAERVRAELAPAGPPEERRMFGGLAFLVGGHMAVCVSGQGGLLVRLTEDESAALVGDPHVEPMVMGGRASRTWVRVDDPGVASDADLGAWVARGLAIARSLPPK